MSIHRFVFTVFAVVTLALPFAAQSSDAGGTVLVTGANRGIGLALAETFHANGYDVIGTARKPGNADELNALGVRVEQLDVTDPASIKALAASLGGEAVDILINNAGIKGHDAQNLADLDIEQLKIVLDVNSLGPLRVTQALMPNVQASDRKIVANISSMMGSMELNTWGCCLGYRASKSAVNSFTKTLSVNYKDSELVFVTMHPGYVQTDMNDGQGNITTKQSAEGLFRVITGLTAANSGGYYDWKGEELPW